MKPDIKTFFYYNWWKLLLVAVLAVAVVYSFCQCNSKINTDFGILYISEDEMADADTFRQTVLGSGVIADADGKDGINFRLREIYIPESYEVMHQQRVPEQIQVELISGECTLYILDKETIYENEAMDIFYDMSSLAAKYGIESDRLYMGNSGIACAISLEGNKLLNNGGAPCNSLYLAVKNHDEATDDTKLKNALAFAEYILKNQ